MSNVYSFFGFAKILIKNNIIFSIRDFLDDKKVDELIQKLVDNQISYKGAGIDRSCFIDYRGECAIKVDKSFYIDESDDFEQECYEEKLYDQYGDAMYEYWVEGNWAINKLYEITKSKHCCDQNLTEVKTYQQLIAQKSNLLDFLPQLYATSSNKCVEILEICEDYKPDEQRMSDICQYFSDVHTNNLGVNRKGKLVLLDIGLC